MFLYPRAVDDPATALDLVARESDRLRARLPQMLERVRDGGDTSGPSTAALMEGSAALETEIGRFLREVLARSCPPNAVARAVTLETRLDLLASLRETVGAYEGIMLQVTDEAVRQVTRPMTESLHFVLTQLDEMEGPEDHALLLTMSGDRGDLMEQLRRKASASRQALSYASQDQLFRSTTQFERAVWLVRRLALLGDRDAAEPVPMAA